MTKSDWKKCKLGDVISIKHGFAFKGDFFVETPTPYILVTPGNFNIGGGFKDAKLKYYNGPIPQDYILKPGDVIVTMTDLSKAGDTLGYSALVPELKGKILLHNQRIGLVLSESISISKQFIYWLMREHNYQQYIVNTASGSTVKHTSPSRIEAFEFLLPPIEEQKRIAGILGSLDDKIELLQKQNKTLEDMAKAIFKSWFVDFDIVKAKQQGRPKADIMREYYLTDELYDLFPSDFENSSLGPIPLGWQVKKLGSFFPVKTGKKDANVASKNGKYPFFSCAQNILWTDEYSFDDTALLLAGNGDFNLKWYRGKFEAYQRTYVLIPNEKLDLPFLYYAMQFFLDKITLGSRGSVIKFITKGMIENYPLVVPEMPIWNYTANLLGQWINKIEANLKQIQTLTELRDTLLPALISGKIRV